MLSSVFVSYSILVLFTSIASVGGASDSFTIKDKHNNDVTVHYETVGCFKDKPHRTLRTHYHTFGRTIDWENEWPAVAKVIVKECAVKAYDKGYKIMFGVQHYKECWSDDYAESRFARDGKSQNCIQGLGGSWANQIYRFTQVINSPPKQCKINEKVYNVNKIMHIPNDWSASPENAMCLNCTCSSDGTPRDCKTLYYCDNQGPMCARYKNVTGRCCPVCDCFYNEKVMEKGSKWIIKSGDVCTKCTCGDNGIADCESQHVLCFCDGDQIPDPDNCCPKCVPKTTTTEPPIAMTLPPTRPPPTFPPFPGPQ